MGKCSCFSLSIRKKKKVKGDDEYAKAGEVDKAIRTLQHRLQHQHIKIVEVNEMKPVKHFGPLIPYGVDMQPIKCEAEDDLQARRGNAGKDVTSRKMDCFESDKDFERGVDRLESRQHSNPAEVRKAEFWCSRELTRSCSNFETHKLDGKMQSKLQISETRSLDPSQGLAESDPGSPASVGSHFSSDKVMLRKHSSSQVLPSRSRTLWSKLFLWSQRNMKKSSSTATPKQVSNKIKLIKQRGYSHDTLEPNRVMQLEKGKNIMNDGAEVD